MYFDATFINDVKNHSWDALAAFIAIVAIAVTIIIFFIQKKKKEITYQIITSTQLLSMKSELSGQVEIFYQKVPVKNVHLYELLLSNTGDIPINLNDYVEPISLVYEEQTEILLAEISANFPDNLGASLSINSSIITISPVLLNPNDSFSIKLLVSNNEELPEIKARISGVTSIINKHESLPFLSILGLPLTIGSAVYLFSKVDLKQSADINFGLIGVLSGYAMMTSAFFKNRQMKIKLFMILQKIFKL